jgi:hypothetical protein
MSEKRSALGRLGALSLHAKYDSRELTSNGRAAFLGRFPRQVIEAAEAAGEVLSSVEIERRAEYLKRAYFLGLALKSAKARRARSGGAR